MVSMTVLLAAPWNSAGAVKASPFGTMMKRDAPAGHRGR